MVKPNLRNIWAPAVPIRRPDNIVSSKAREQNNAGFKSSSEKDKKEDMWLVMSNGYHAQWFKERAVYERNTYYRWETIKQEKKVKRRFIQRMMTYRTPTRNEYLEEYVAARQQNKDFLENCEYSYYKYKPQLPPSHESSLTVHNTQKQESKAMQHINGKKLDKQHRPDGGKSKKREKKIIEPKESNTKTEEHEILDGAEAVVAEICYPCTCQSK